MSDDGVAYREATASAAAIQAHLALADDVRQGLLARGVDSGCYAAKLAARATTFEAWLDGALVGLVAAYLNDPAGRIGYITNVSVVAAARGNGIALALLRRCLDRAMAGGFHTVMLEVSRDNRQAIALYGRIGFEALPAAGERVPMQIALNRGN